MFGPFLHDKELSVHDKETVAIRQQQIVHHDLVEKEKVGCTSSHKMELEERWWQKLLEPSTQSWVRQKLALKHALFVTIADSIALVELCGAMGIAAKFHALHFLRIILP